MGDNPFTESQQSKGKWLARLHAHGPEVYLSVLGQDILYYVIITDRYSARCDKHISVTGLVKFESDGDFGGPSLTDYSSTPDNSSGKVNDNKPDDDEIPF